MSLISDFLVRNASYQMFLTAITAASYLLWHFSEVDGKIRGITGGLPTLDSRRTGYSPSDVYRLFEALGADGLDLYKQWNWLDLLVFPLVVSTLMAMAMGKLLQQARFPTQYCILPFVYAAAEVAENCCIFWMLHTWPSFSPQVATASSLLTGFKWRFFFYSLGGVFISGLLFLRKLLSPKPRPQPVRPHLE